MTLKTRIYLASASSGLVALAGMAGFAALASAAATEVPSITAVVYTSGGNAVTNAVVGTSLHAVATVASSTASTTPTGTVDFNVYNGTSCSGTAVTQTLALDKGQATSSNTVLPIGGLSYMVHYNGQGDLYLGGNSVCKSVSATQVAPAISLTLSTTTSVLAGSFVNAIPNLTNETAGADGILQYRVYSNNTCSTQVLNAGDKTVTNGSTPNSDSWQFITAGTYYWQVAYSGDADNAAATSSCAASGTVLTVIATTSTPIPPATPGTISGTVYNDLNKNDKQDNGEAGLSGWTVWLHKTATTSNNWWNNWFKKNNKNLYNAPIVATATTDANGNYSFGNLAAGTYFVEESVMKGWKQTSDDTKVVLNAAKTSADVDFSNIMKKATTTKQNNDNNNNDNNDKGGKNGKNDEQAKANGWFQYTGNIPALGNVFGWLHLSVNK